MFKDFKTVVFEREQSRNLQQLAIDNGYTHYDDGTNEVKSVNNPYLFFSNNFITTSNKVRDFEDSGIEHITYDDAVKVFNDTEKQIKYLANILKTNPAFKDCNYNKIIPNPAIEFNYKTGKCLFFGVEYDFEGTKFLLTNYKYYDMECKKWKSFNF
jgi:hypothetical protein